MKIYFFEEFETKENLNKIKLIDFPTKVIFAAREISQFRSVEKKLKKNKFVKDVIYWPVLTKKEGYYISAFSKTTGLKRVLNQILQEKKINCMLDLEFPLQRDVFMFIWTIIKRLPSYLKNKKIIFDFLKKAEKKRIDVYTAEYDIPNGFAEHLFGWFCLTFNPRKYKHKRIVMLYTSFIKNMKIEDYLLKQLKKSRMKYKGDFLVGLGTIAKGILRTEPILSTSHLEHDLNIMKKNGIKEIVIFRLGGLNKDYVEVIKKYVS